MRHLVAASLPVALVAFAACTGSEKPDEPDPPTIALLAPETDFLRAQEWLAVAGHATGELERVEVIVDDGDPVEATGTEEWHHLLDVTVLADGSHAISARAIDEDDRVAVTAVQRSFISTANQPEGTAILAGVIRDSDQVLLPGARASAYEGTLETRADPYGRYALVGAPLGDEILLVGSHAGYAATYMPRFQVGGDAFDFDVPLFTPAVLDLVAAQYAVTRTDGLGTVLGFLVEALPGDGGHAGAVLALDGATGDGPFYAAPDGDFDPDLTETTAAGVFLFFNVSVGPVAVTASDAAATFNLLGSESVGDSVTILFGRAL